MTRGKYISNLSALTLRAGTSERKIYHKMSLIVDKRRKKHCTLLKSIVNILFSRLVFVLEVEKVVRVFYYSCSLARGFKSRSFAHDIGYRQEDKTVLGRVN